MSRRILTILLAIVMAVIGVGVVLIYVKGANQRAIAGQRAVNVLVATQQVPAGTTAATALSEGLISAQRLPAQSVPPDAVTSITSDLRGLVFSSNLASGQLVLRPILVSAVQAATGLPIPVGKVAVTIQMCVQAAVADYIQAGSQIAIFNTYYRTVAGSASSGSVTQSCAGASFSKGVSAIHARLVLNDVQVLAVGTPAPAGSQATTTGATSAPAAQGTVMVTVALDQQDAERLIELAEAGLTYMALVTSSSHTSPDFTFKP